VTPLEQEILDAVRRIANTYTDNECADRPVWWIVCDHRYSVYSVPGDRTDAGFEVRAPPVAAAGRRNSDSPDLDGVT
jgi:hypothetical protein